MNDAQILAKLRIDYSLILRELAEKTENYADNLALLGEKIHKGEHENEVAIDLVIDLHETILRLQKTINELEVLLKIKNDGITEPRKKENKNDDETTAG